jgi:hypothetical protein
VEIKLIAVQGTTNVYILSIDASDNELVAEVLFSYGKPVAAKVWVNQAEAPKLDIVERRLIKHSISNTYLAKDFPGKLTDKHIRRFFWPNGYEADKRAAYYLLEEEEADYIEGILIGRMPPISKGERKYA